MSSLERDHVPSSPITSREVPLIKRVEELKLPEEAIYRAFEHAHYTSVLNAKQKKPTMAAQYRKVQILVHSVNIEATSVLRRTRNTGIIDGM